MEEEFIYSGSTFDFTEWKEIEKRKGSQDGMLYILGDTKYRFSKKEYITSSGENITLEAESSNNQELSTSHNYEQGFPNITVVSSSDSSSNNNNNNNDNNDNNNNNNNGTPVETKISLVSADAIDTALILSDFKDEDLRPALLNMAAFTNPGGKYNIGEKAQEEMIYYRSNIWSYLDPEGKSGLGGKDAVTLPHYPLPVIGGLYTPGVTFIRGSEADKFRLTKPRSIDIISVAALKFPKLVDGEYSSEDREKMCNKIRTILTIA